MDYKRILVTSALPYANGPIHLGHIAGAYLPADIFVRYQKLLGKDIVFICGTDEHGVPITIAAEKEGVSPQDIVDRYHERIKNSFQKLGIDFTNFSRTTTKIHYELSQEFFLTLNEKGYLTKKEIRQLFCLKDNMFLSDRYVEGTCPHCGRPEARGDQCESCGKWIDQVTLIEPKCKLCGSTPEIRTTAHWFFNLARFQAPLEKWISSKKGWKDNVINFCNGWFGEGLEERAVTRDLRWGVPVPLAEAKGKVLYVWFDAPIGYISSTIEWAIKNGTPEKWKEYWQDEGTRLIHFIGKDNIVFHALFFPAILMGHGDYILPDNVPANEFLNIESQKFSTSRNFAVWVDDYLERFPPDPLRYNLASIMPENKDADFSWKDFQARNNFELADILGNFVHRTLTFVAQRFEGRVPGAGTLRAEDSGMLRILETGYGLVGEYIEKFQFRNACREMMNVARAANKYFNDSEPWVAYKTDMQKCAATIFVCVSVVKGLAVMMSPFLPFTADKIWEILKVALPLRDHVWGRKECWNVAPGHETAPPDILFEKIEDEIIEREEEKLLRRSQSQSVQKKEKMMTEPVDKIDINAFRKVELKTAKILEAARVEGTDKLMRLQLDLGAEKRQIIAGIAKHYTPESLPGKTIIIVANLEPAKLRGEISEGMLLAASSGDILTLLTTDTELPPGSAIS